MLPLSSSAAGAEEALVPATPAGVAAYRDLREVALAYDETLEAKVTKEEVELLRRMLRRLGERD